MGCVQLPTWGWSFYSSLDTPMKKFRTIAGQRLHTTYPLIRNNCLGRYGMSAERPEICSKQQHLQGTHTTPKGMGPNENADGEAFPENPAEHDKTCHRVSRRHPLRRSNMYPNSGPLGTADNYPEQDCGKEVLAGEGGAIEKECEVVRLK